MKNLTPLQLKVLLLLKDLKPYERIEIWLKDGKIMVKVQSTVVEDFPVDSNE